MIIYVILNEKYSLKPTRLSKYQNCEVRTGVEKTSGVVTTSTTSDAKFGNLIDIKDFINCVIYNCPGAFFHVTSKVVCNKADKSAYGRR